MNTQDSPFPERLASCDGPGSVMSHTQPPGEHKKGVKAPRYIVHIESVGDGSVVQRMAFLDNPRITLGRGSQNQVCLPASDKTVSSNHAELVQSGHGHVLRDLDSRNGIYLCAGAEPTRVREVAIEPGAPAVEVSLGMPGPLCRIWTGQVYPFADYLVMGQLGQGGMARVFAAQDGSGLNRLVVLKIIASHFRSSIDPADAEAMLELEARLTGLVSHPNVVRIHRIGSVEGTPYIEMEYLVGVNLASIQQQLASKRMRCPVDLAAALLSQACLGLHAAHDACDASGRPLQIVHRDFTPSNIMVLPTGDVKLIDFGVARALGTRSWSTGGAFVGKVAYAAPEQISRPHAIDRRADLFAAGVILYELLAGRSLFARETDYATMSAVLHDPVPPIAGIPGEVNSLLQHLLARNPEDRPSSAETLAHELEQLVLRGGGHFLQRRNIAHSLRQFGVSLDAPVPRALSGRPTVFPPVGAVESRRPSLGTALANPPRHSRGNLPAPAQPASITVPGSHPDFGDSPPGASAVPPTPSRVSQARTQRVLGAVPRQLLPARISLPSCAVDLGETLHEHCAETSGGYASVVLSGRVSGATTLSAEVLVYLLGAPGLAGALPAALRACVSDWLRYLAQVTLGGPLLPAVACGEAWRGGPQALILKKPTRTWASALAREAGARVHAGQLIRGLFRCLATVQECFPRFTHGELAPSEVALISETDEAAPATRPCLVPGRWLDWLVSTDHAGFAAVGQRPLDRSLYLAPECFRGEPPTPASDVFSAAMMGYELLGGHLTAAAWALRQGGRLPSLPPGDGPLSALREAIVAALHPDPRRRPVASEFLRQSDELGAPPAPSVLSLSAPAAGEVCTQRDREGRRLHLHTLRLHPAQRGPQTLPFQRVPQLLPSAVGLLRFRGNLAVEILAGSADSGRSRLYTENHATGTERLFLHGSAGSFEVGSRSQNCLQRIDYQLAPTESRASVHVAALGLQVASPELPCGAVLWTREPRSGDLHVCCAQLAE